MPTFSQIKERYPEIKDIRGYVFFTTTSVNVDGYFTTEQLRQICRFVEDYNLAFGQWYEKCRQIEPSLYEEACNAFYHNFADGMTPEDAVKASSQYGIKKE